MKPFKRGPLSLMVTVAAVVMSFTIGTSLFSQQQAQSLGMVYAIRDTGIEVIEVPSGNRITTLSKPSWPQGLKSEWSDISNVCFLSGYLYATLRLRRTSGDFCKINLATGEVTDLDKIFGFSGESDKVAVENGPAVVHGNRLAFLVSNRALNRLELRQYSTDGKLLVSVVPGDWSCSAALNTMLGDDSNKSGTLLIPNICGYIIVDADSGQQILNIDSDRVPVYHQLFSYDGLRACGLGTWDHPGLGEPDDTIYCFDARACKVISRTRARPFFTQSMTMTHMAGGQASKRPNSTLAYVAVLSNADDKEELYVNGRLVATSSFGQAQKELELTQFLRPGDNEIKLVVWNDGGGYCWGLEMRDATGKVIVRDVQGQAGRAGANGNDQTKGKVYEHEYHLTY